MRYKPKYKLKQPPYAAKALELPQAAVWSIFGIETILKFFKIGTAVFLFAVFLIFNLLVSPPGDFPVGKTIKIDSGLNLWDIKNYLREEKVIKYPFMFDLMMRAIDGDKVVKAGYYVFKKPFSAFEVAKKIIAGDYGIEYKKILIKEGMKLSDIESVFKKEGMEQMNGLDRGLEGYFFPDTYFFPVNISKEDAVKLINKNFEEKAVSVFAEEIEKSGRNLYDILIMASILEKEANTKEEKTTISDILWRRLEKGIPLQVDASLEYDTGRNTFELTKEDLKNDSPYNTYRNKGLPATPISNPGARSIEAALKPLSNTFWFYLSDMDSVVHYSETYEEHKAKVEEYLR